MCWQSIRVDQMCDWLIVDDGWSIAGGGLLFNDVDKLEGAADGRVRFRPLGTLKVTHL